MTQIDDQLEAWARWRLTRTDGGGLRSPLGRLIHEGVSTENVFQSRIPINTLECGLVERFVMALAPVQRKAIEEQYLYSNTVADKASRCVCSVAGFYKRLNKARGLIGEMSTDYHRNGIEPQPWAKSEAQLTGRR